MIYDLVIAQCTMIARKYGFGKVFESFFEHFCFIICNGQESLELEELSEKEYFLCP